MRKTNVLSAILVLVFMLSCFTFFSASATEDGETPTESSTVETVATETTVETETTTVPTTTTTITTATTIKKTTVATAADPVYTESTTKTTTTTAAVGVVTDSQGGTKETKEIQTTEEITEPTSAAKNIVNYGSKYRPLKWFSLVVMIACVAGLVAVNVRYKKKYGKNNSKQSNAKGKSSRKPQLDTSARFTPPVEKETDENMDKTAVVDLSSFSKREPKKAYNPKLVDDDFFGEKQRKEDDDLYI